MKHNTTEVKTNVLPRGKVLEQNEVQAALAKGQENTGSLDAVLRELEEWENSIGYFDHLTEENVFLSFPDARLDLDLRLQVNYSRLSYKAPAGQKKTVECPLCIENIGIPGKELDRKSVV